MTITRAAPAQFDPNFACCGGCSSSKRADAYNEKLATGSLVFIWDIKLKTDPQPVCTLTFPYDPALNEQVGERRVRSGRLVGTSYPIDNDYDYLCCEQRGQCLALNEDASGKCQCVKRWGFTGDHCQDSVYDVAEAANAKVFPNATNLSSVDHLLPDLRTYLLSFDYDSAIASASTSDTSTGDFDASNGRLTAGYDAIASEIQQVSLFGLYALCGMCGFALILALSAFAHGILTGQRKLGRTACFFSEITFLIAVVLIGVLYTMSVMAQDAIVVLQRLDENTYAFLPSTQSAEDVNRLLFDQNFVEATDMVETLAFSDTLRVPPHPTPATDDPDRFNFTALYDMPTLFALEKLTANSDQALVELFAWSEDFVKSHYDGLQVLVFSDSSTPYNGTLHQELLNSTIQKLMDPDGDGELVTANDLLTIQTVFNESWRGVSDEGASLNKDIQSEWLFVAQLYFQKQKLETYVATVSSFIAKIHPLLVKTQTMEDAEFQLKAPVEFVTDSIRASRLGDCNYNGNCAWFRAALNELFDLFQQIVLKAERAAIICAVSAVALLLSVLSTNAFTSRQRRVVVKVYSAN
ncbi:hypothetical protein PR003_g12513 [Phytophthora rubi]|uniref:EGF-like domain-containing protein n=1 Tax=Phytophthora rubi TaxID=129364 RepID=A0A6A4F028_9STRA|nr:hypothetical protein PR003_g12513 [Phytophthora rubi]